MGRSISRIQFLRGDFQGERPALRPPWALPEALFLDRCDRCGDCIRVCPEAILKHGRGDFPVVDFARAGCSFCRACLDACKPRALERDAEDGEPWAHKAEIGNTCLARRGIVCRSCGETCDEGAIRFRPESGGVARPRVNLDGCNGCGGCLRVCPVDAIQIRTGTLVNEAA